MTRASLAVQLRLSRTLDDLGRRQAGQGTLEYVGMIVAVAAVLVLVIAAVRNFDLAARIQDAFNSVFAG